MKTYLDNAFIQILTPPEENESGNPLLSACIDADILTNTVPLNIVMEWPSLLEYLGLGHVLENIPLFNPQYELYTFILSLLPLESERELLIRAYDQIFVECLTYVKALPHIQPTFLLEQIEKKQQASSRSPEDHLFAKSLDHYRKGFSENPSHLMHDLILYLAWDRVCINLAILFEHSSPDASIHSGLHLLKECLLESFQHITAQGRTTPSFFRLIEALYAYDMREENLDNHTEADWLILCQSASALKSRDRLPDVWFIDAAMIEEGRLKEMEGKKNLVRFFTLDTADKVKASLSLTRYTIDKLKKSVFDWRFTLSPVQVICCKEEGDKLVIDTIVDSG